MFLVSHPTDKYCCQYDTYSNPSVRKYQQFLEVKYSHGVPGQWGISRCLSQPQSPSDRRQGHIDCWHCCASTSILYQHYLVIYQSTNTTLPTTNTTLPTINTTLPTTNTTLPNINTTLLTTNTTLPTLLSPHSCSNTPLLNREPLIWRNGSSNWRSARRLPHQLGEMSLEWQFSCGPTHRRYRAGPRQPDTQLWSLQHEYWRDCWGSSSPDLLYRLGAQLYHGTPQARDSHWERSKETESWAASEDWTSWGDTSTYWPRQQAHCEGGQVQEDERSQQHCLAEMSS